MEFKNDLVHKFKSFIAITRWTEVIDFNFILTFVGFMVIPVAIGLNFVLAFFANFSALIFAFMFNDVEDAEEDYHNEKKRKRNPVSNGSITKGEGYVYSTLVAIISLILYAFLAYQSNNIWPFIAGVSIMIVNILYSYRKIRLKNIPIVDLFSHGYMLAGGQFLVAFFAGFNIAEGKPLTVSFLMFPVLMIASMYGQLENEVRDYETDKKVGIKTLATIIGIIPSQVLQVILLLIVGGLGTFVITKLNIPLNWVIQTIILVIVLMVYPLFRNYLHKDLRMFKDDIHKMLLLGAIVSIILLNYHIIL